MEIPCRVQIQAPHRYRGWFNGLFGEVVRRSSDSVSSNTVGVKVDGYYNKRSAYGVYWFKISELVPENENKSESEETKMLLPNYTAASVQFLSGSNAEVKYTYALYDETVVVGDTVVVQTGHHGLALAQVVEISADLVPKVACNREIVAKVDFTAFYDRQARAKRLAELRAAMDTKVKELQALALYDMLAEKDPALKDLLTEYRELSGQ